MRRQVDRRRAIRLGAVTGAVALAGCLGGDGDSGNTDGEPGSEGGATEPDWTVFTGNPPEHTRYLSSSVLSGDGAQTVADGPFEVLARHELVLTYTGFDAFDRLGALGVFDEQEGPQVQPDDPGSEDERFSVDPLLSGPLFVAGTTVLTGALVGSTGLAPLVEGVTASEQAGRRQSRFDTTIRAELFTPEAVVLQGEIEPEEVGSLLEQPPRGADDTDPTRQPGDADPTGQTRPGGTDPTGSDEPEVGEGENDDPAVEARSFDFAETVGGYDVYEDSETEGPNDRQRVAVGPSEVIWAGIADVETTIETARGERERATEAFEGLGRLLGPLVDSQLLFGVYDPDGIGTRRRSEGARPLLGTVDAAFDGIAYGGSVDDEGIESVATLLASEPIDGQTERSLRDQLGSEAERVEFEQSGREMLVTGEYSAETLESI